MKLMMSDGTVASSVKPPAIGLGAGAGVGAVDGAGALLGFTQAG